MSAPPFRKRLRTEQEAANSHRCQKPRVIVDGDELAKALREVLGRAPERDRPAEDPADSDVPNIAVAKFAADFGSPDRDGIARGN